MATYGPVTSPDTANDANFRGAVQAVRDALLAIGMVRTADTGQIDTTTAVKPGNGVVAGYDIFRFSDALQATTPVFIKVEYGTNSPNGGGITLWMTVGSATDGAGTITGVTYASRVASGINGSGNRNVRASGGTNRMGLYIGDPGGSSGATAYFSVERTKDSVGNDTNEGVVTMQWGYSTARYTVGGKTAGMGAATGNLPALDPQSGIGGFASLGVDVFFSSPVFALGKPVGSLGVLAFRSSDVGVGGIVPVSVLGATHQYFVIGQALYNSAFFAAILWE